MNMRFRSTRSTAGFTLLEMIVIMVIIGVLFAIAAPGWDNLLSRQRVSTAREQTLQIIRKAQADARTSRSARAVVFDITPAGGGTPRVATIAYPSGTAFSTLPGQVGSGSWKALGGDSVGPKAIKLSVNSPNNALVFDSSGAVARPPIVPAHQLSSLPNSEFAVTVSREGAGVATRRCVIIPTLLGASRLAEGSDCP